MMELYLHSPIRHHVVELNEAQGQLYVFFFYGPLPNKTIISYEKCFVGRSLPDYKPYVHVLENVASLYKSWVSTLPCTDRGTR
jgi:hypothetical protein